jgi:hypothetical protein
VGAADAVCAKYDRPSGVAFLLQVCEYNVEPAPSNRRRNLLSKDDWRTALLDEAEEGWPEVSFIL